MNTTRKNTNNSSANTFNNVSNVNALSAVAGDEVVFFDQSRSTSPSLTTNSNISNMYEPKSVKIYMISLNLASQSEPTPITDESIGECKPDFLVEMTQEDYRPVEPISLFESSIVKGYSRVAVIGLNKKKRTEQNVVLRIFRRVSSIVDHSGLKVGSQILKPKGKNNAGYFFQKVASTLRLPKYGYSKGMVWAKLSFPESSLLFANMHLPMKKKSLNLGLGLREKALGLLLTELKKHMDPRTTLIIGGDLNFRMNYQGVNQLTTLLNTKFTMLRELPFPDPSQRRYTCKFKPLSEANSSCEMKRLTAVPNNEGTAEEIAKNLQKDCAVSNRIPSRCDRFLYKEAAGKTVSVVFQKALPLDAESDHNALVACIEVNEA
jgi:hypothetical protein